MESTHIEAKYPLDFREDDARALGEHLHLRHNVELVGMKRVGISNFLRYFLYHKDIVPRYIGRAEKHLFIPVDLNNLVEIDLFPFWILTLKRLADKVERSADIPDKVKKDISVRFLETIQSKDAFLAIESLRKSIAEVVKEGVMPTFFFIRFDRLASAISIEFFRNLIGLSEETGHKLSYVFTSFRALDEIAPEVFERKLLSVFSHPMYIKPAKRSDMEIIFDTLEEKYNISPSHGLRGKLIDLVGGHVQYLQLSLIVLNQRNKAEKMVLENLLDVISGDERVILQSEEIWESLNSEERRVLLAGMRGQELEKKDRINGKYLADTGIVEVQGQIFSPLFEGYVAGLKNGDSDLEKVDLTKKEKSLYDFLLSSRDEVCERDNIIEAVWPEVEELGVSDWTIDRLVARLRTKLKKQKSKYQIVTVKTRGYKLTS
ncbi:MAG: helix-turn-helix domain-containing protein [Candidatus Curtissbacteria bacterium]